MTTTTLDPVVAEESAIVRAQAAVYSAMREVGVDEAELARRIGVTSQDLLEVLDQDGNDRLTVRLFARMLRACGAEVHFDVRRIE